MLVRHCEIEFFWVLKCWLNKKKATEKFNSKGIQKSELCPSADVILPHIFSMSDYGTVIASGL